MSLGSKIVEWDEDSNGEKMWEKGTMVDSTREVWPSECVMEWCGKSCD